MKRIHVIILTIFLAVCLNEKILGQSGSLDSTFGTNGKVVTDLGSNYEYGKAPVIQSDGKIIVVGRYQNIAGHDAALVRYNSNGTLDNTFGTGGIVITDIGSQVDDCSSIALDQFGKIVVAGRYSNGTTGDVAVMRYNSDGTLDNSFGSGGKVTTSIVGPNHDNATDLVIQPDGKIIVGGQTGFPGSGDYNFALLRYNTNGLLDSTFGSGGRVITDFGINKGDYLLTIALQADGKIITAGRSSNGLNNDFALARYDSNGTLDNTFGSSGKVRIDFGTGNENGIAVALQQDGKIILSGNIDLTESFAMVRCNSDGTLDNTFGSNGKVTTNFTSTSDDFPTTIAILANGNIILGGTSTVGNNYNFALAAYDTNGALDQTFGLGGKVTTDIGSIDDFVNGIAVQPNGMIILVGSTFSSSAPFNYDFALARYKVGNQAGHITEIKEREASNKISIAPNPISDITNVNYTLNKPSTVHIEIYNFIGQNIYTLLNTDQSAGDYSHQFEIGAYNAGIYFLKIKINEAVTVKQIIKVD